MDSFRWPGGDGGGIISAAGSSVKNSPSWVLLVGGAVALVLLSMVYNSARRKFSNLPPGPRNWPVIGAMFEMEPQIHQAFAKLAKKHGPIVYFKLGEQQIVVLSDSQVAEDLLRHRDGQFTNRFTLMTRTPAKYCRLDGGGLLWGDHNDNALRRKIMINEFFTVGKLKTYDDLRRQESAALVEKILHTVEGTNKSMELKKGEDGVSIAMKELFFMYQVNILFALVMGIRWDGLSPTSPLREFIEIRDEFERLVMKFNVEDVLPFLKGLIPRAGVLKEYEAHSRKLREFFGNILADRRKLRAIRRAGKTVADTDDQTVRKNFVDVMLNLQEEGTKMDDDYLLETLLGILTAGIDASASSQEWVMLELVRHPEMLKRLQAEIDGVVGKDCPLDETHIQSMPYLNAIVTETIRLHPVLPISFPHTNDETNTLAGYTIPRQTAVILNIVSINRDPKVWKDPLQFNPERFIGVEGEKIKANVTNYNIMSFGGGRRGCAGRNLAWVLLLRTTATLVHAFDWSPPPGLSVKDLPLEESVRVGGALLKTTDDVFLTATPRPSSKLYHSNILLKTTVAQ